MIQYFWNSHFPILNEINFVPILLPPFSFHSISFAVGIWNAGTIISSSMQAITKEYQDEGKSCFSSSSWIVNIFITSDGKSDISYIYLSWKFSFFAESAVS